MYGQEALLHKALCSSSTPAGSVGLGMGWGRQKRHYTVCEPCGRWIWTDRITARPVCQCGRHFPSNNKKVRPASTQQQKQQHSSGKLEALPSAAQQVESQVKSVLKTFVASLPKEQKEKFLADFPVVGDKGSAKGDSDPFRKVSSSCAAAFKEYKRLADKKHSIESKARRLQDQLDKLSEDLAQTTEDLDRAQEVHEEQLRTYSSVVQHGPLPDSTSRIRPFEDDEGSDITGDVDEMSDDKGEQRPSNEAEPTPTPTATQQDPSTQEAPTQGAGSGGGRWSQRYQAAAETEDEDFKKFRESLSEEQREVLDRQMQKATEPVQKDSKKAVQAQELMETARVMAGFVQALQTVPAMYSG